MSPDVIVVGAGPAGATAARTLALGGARVWLLDRHEFPRNKPCGGAISARALTRFPYLEGQLHRIAVHPVTKLHLESPGGCRSTLQSEDRAVLMIRRLDFDHLLVELARQAGAELMAGVEIAQAAMDEGGVSLTSRDGRRFRAPLAIAADGVNSVVARRLGLNPGWPRSSVALDMMEETPIETLKCAEPDALWVSYGHGGSAGYAYIFPKARHVNVGIGYVLSHFREQVDESPYELQRRFVDSLARRGLLHGVSSRRHFTPFLIPVGGPLPKTAHERVLLAGDAGGFVNGFTAEGIYYAMVTGELAARAALGSARSPEPVATRYVRSWKREIGAELRDSVLLQRYVLGEARRVDLAVKGAERHPRLARAVVQYASGRRSYWSARRRVLLRAPGLVPTLVAQGLTGHR